MAHYTQVTDWTKVKADGVICKATQGASFKDPSFQDKIKGAIADGLVVGAYHFFDPKADPELQAANFAEACLQTKSELILVLDVEEADGWDALTKDQRSEAIFKFLLKLQSYYTGLPFFYMGSNFYNQYLSGVDFSKWPLMVPDYHSQPWSPRLPWCWKTWTIWQSADKDKEAGMIGYADLDTYEGTKDQLKALCCIPH